MAPINVTVVDLHPIDTWVKDVGIEDPLPAADIVARVINHFVAVHVGQVLNPKMFHATISSWLARAFQLQAEMRLGVYDRSSLDKLARSAEVRDLHGLMTVWFPDGWVEDVDRILRTRICGRCGATVPGVAHGPEACDQVMVCDIIES